MTGWWYRDSWPWPLWQGGVHRLPPACGNSLLLTFDDGPSENSLRVSSLLAERALKAVFFLQGERAAEHPERVRELIAAGHRIGSHGLRHVRHGRLSPARVTLELTQARQLLEHLSGQSVPWFRPPYGDYDEQSLRDLAAIGYTKVLLWSCDTRDSLGATAEEILNNCIYTAQPGRIVLMHVGGQSEAYAALPTMIAYLREQGFTFVRADRILEP